MLGRYRIIQAHIWRKVFQEQGKARTKSLKGECVCVAYLKNNKEAGIAVAERARKIIIGHKK